MDITLQAIVMGIVQGLTEFLPISSSGHLILVPHMLGWDDPFITSLAFSVMLHLGTLVALLAYFWRDWVAPRAGRPRHDPRPLVPGRPGSQAGVADRGDAAAGGRRRHRSSTTSSRSRSASRSSSRSCS